MYSSHYNKEILIQNMSIVCDFINENQIFCYVAWLTWLSLYHVIFAPSDQVPRLSSPALRQHSAKRFLDFTAGSYNAPVDYMTAILSTQKTQKEITFNRSSWVANLH